MKNKKVGILFVLAMIVSAMFNNTHDGFAFEAGGEEELEITSYDVFLSPDFDKNALHCRVVCIIRNNGLLPVEQVDFDLFAREKFYGVEVQIADVSQLIEGKTIPQRFSHSEKAPKITRVTLSPSLEKGVEVKMQFDYTFREIDATRQDLPYRIIAELPNGEKEICLLSDFAWLPQILMDYEKLMEMYQRNFFPKTPKPTWNVSITVPIGYEAVVLDGRFVEVEQRGEEMISQWESRAPGFPQVMIGNFDRVVVSRPDASVVFFLPKGSYLNDTVEAKGDFLIRAYRFYSDLFGSLNGDEIHIGASSADMGRHGAYLGMTLDVPYLNWQTRREYDELLAHELSHSWWGNSVSSYGRGTKFLRESMANFSAWHLARELFGTDKFADYRARLFMSGDAKNPLFLRNPDRDDVDLAYSKGALILDILRSEMGDELFFQCLKTFAAKFKDSHATFSDFVSVCNEVSKQDWEPFFEQWLYGEGYPIYHLVSFQSEPERDEWRTSVTIRNDGKGTILCPLELRMGDEAQRETFRVPEGVEETFTYRTPAKVDQVIIDPDHTTFQGTDIITPEEKALVDEFHKIKARIMEGEKFNDCSTPIRALLTRISGWHHRDVEAIQAVEVWAYGPQPSKEELMKHEFYDRLAKQLDSIRVLRVPVPKPNPSNGDVHPIFTIEGQGEQSVYVFFYYDGRWRSLYNTYDQIRWDRGLDEVLRHTLEFLQSVEITPVEPKGKKLLTWGALKNCLYQNYPNPFNPDTWIPFELRWSKSDSIGTDVSISIYNLRGQLVRQLHLGNLPAGKYIDRSKAAYWDGRNENGEKAASEMYFYTLQAGNYSATKRMLMLK